MILLEKFIINSEINSTTFNVLETVTKNIKKKDILCKIKKSVDMFKKYLIQEFCYPNNGNK